MTLLEMRAPHRSNPVSPAQGEAQILRSFETANNSPSGYIHTCAVAPLILGIDNVGLAE